MSERQDIAAKPYRVLARKYRPRDFSELRGQDALVRTLTNAIKSGRIAQAYMLTGVRGVGKTTTARIIAKALNYTGPDGTAGPTTGSTEDCAICQAIAADRHPDVMEMDAASRTGVDDIREILDGVRYAPTSARYKVYIIDEVHMLSRAAFNALLKTLEEPPPHVVFIFATTEIRKVPVTVLSRCQRFDLRRFDIETLGTYYREICEKEQVSASEEAIALIARAADGSARDGLSILDQAIALSDGKVEADLVKDMLGLADRSRVLDMLEHAMKGECADALVIAADLYAKGADPFVLVQDMLDFTHIMTRLRAAPDASGLQAALGRDVMERAGALARDLGMPALGRTWQILLKALNEVQQAPAPFAALEMLLIRLAYTADLPDPADLMRKIKSGAVVAPNGAPSVAPAPVAPQSQTMMKQAVGGGFISEASAPAPIESTLTAPESLQNLQNIVDLLEEQRQMILAGQVFHNVHLVRMEPGRLDVALTPDAVPSLTQDLRNFLIAQTGIQWFVSIVGQQGAPTLAQQREALDASLLENARAHPVVQAALETFPGATLSIIKN